MDLLQNIKYRKLSPKDANSFLLLHKKCLPESKISIKDAISYINLEQYYSCGMFHEKDLLAFLVLMRCDYEADIVTIGVEVKHRCLGLATNLLLNCIKDAEIKEVFLEVSQDNFSAIRFYKKMGFQKCSYRKDYYNTATQSKNAFVMKKCFT